MPTYVAEWGVFVISDHPLTPLEAAQKAAEMVTEPHRQIWGITDVDTQESCAVDLTDGRVIQYDEVIEFVDEADSA